MVPVLVLLAGLVAIAAIWSLQRRASHSLDARLALANAEIEINLLQGAAFRASPTTGGSPAEARRQMEQGKARIARTLDRLLGDAPPAPLRRVREPLRANLAALERIYAIGASGAEHGRDADRLAASAGRSSGEARTLLDAASMTYEDRASRAQRDASIGSAGVILALLAGFGFFYRRSVTARATAERLARENKRLLALSRHEALSDALTGLRNRRALVNDLEEAISTATDDRRLLLALFDLDGFKQYNDTFGHPAGDALLVRLGERLDMAMSGRATAYRMGGDEFCVLAPIDRGDADEVAELAALALSEAGEAFEVGCSYGLARMPEETRVASEALRIADQRMYAQKAGRSSASRQSTDVLLQVLTERNADLHEHLNDVAVLARRTAEDMGLAEHDVRQIELAGELHDVGKVAIPDTILNKPGKLDADEWRFVRRHSVIGERIVRAAPSLAHVATLVRACHERFDHGGYPDGIGGEQIPLGARIIAVCDAFDAMVSERPYRAAMMVEEALAELRRCSGTQFDPRVVERVCALVEDSEESRLQPA